jgi:hypothetical protein
MKRVTIDYRRGDCITNAEFIGTDTDTGYSLDPKNKTVRVWNKTQTMVVEREFLVSISVVNE